MPREAAYPCLLGWFAHAQTSTSRNSRKLWPIESDTSATSARKRNVVLEADDTRDQKPSFINRWRMCSRWRLWKKYGFGPVSRDRTLSFSDQS
jgi:hypothetical protein